MEGDVRGGQMFRHQILRRLVYTGLLIACSMRERLIYMTLNRSVGRAAAAGA